MKNRFLFLLSLLAVPFVAGAQVSVKKASDLTLVTTPDATWLVVLSDPAGAAAPKVITVGNLSLNVLPAQGSHSGQILTTNGSATSWVAESALLDGISSTRGAVLYRGASGWAAAAPGTSGFVWTSAGSGADPSWQAVTAGSGTVTSVAMTLPAIFSVSGSPITTSGTLAVTLATETANFVWAGPTTGSAAAPSFRALVAADIPALDWSKITTGKPTTLSGFGITDAVSNTITINGHATTANITITAADVGAVPTSRQVNGHALSGDITLSASDVSAVPTTRQVNGHALSGDITLSASDVSAVPTTRQVNGHALSGDITLSATDVSAVPTTRQVNGHALSGDITLSASDVSAVPTTRQVNGHALSGDVTVTATDVLPSQTGNSGKVLQTNGSAASWQTPSGGGSTAWVVKSANYTAVAGDKILADTSGGTWTLTLPASPSAGDVVAVLDRKKNWGTSNLTIARNGSNIESTASNLTANSAGAKLELIYSGDATVGWRVVIIPSA